MKFIELKEVVNFRGDVDWSAKIANDATTIGSVEVEAWGPPLVFIELPYRAEWEKFVASFPGGIEDAVFGLMDKWDAEQAQAKKAGAQK
jgi:hypothetical protein